MPRLSPSVLRQARSIDPLLTLLLPPCRDIESAQNELRWLREYAIKTTQASHRKPGQAKDTRGWRELLKHHCSVRSKGMPLQYILGSEYFGDVEIRCKPGVLIPSRQETATAVTHLAHLLFRYGDANLPEELRVLDVCTGTGCIPILFAEQARSAHHSRVRLKMLGVDISPRAVELARTNLHQYTKQKDPPLVNCDAVSSVAALENVRHSMPNPLDQVSFVRADVLPERMRPSRKNPPGLIDLLKSREERTWDVLISNPPYISPSSYGKDTARSVRHFEPKLALVPPGDHVLTPQDQGDLFYPVLLLIANHVQAKILLVEVADLDQAQRVATMAAKSKLWQGIEIWRDEPHRLPGSDKTTNNDPTTKMAQTLYDQGVRVRGSGNGRSVFCWRGEAARWLSGSTPS